MPNGTYGGVRGRRNSALLDCQLGCDFPQHRKLLLRELPACVCSFTVSGGQIVMN